MYEVTQHQSKARADNTSLCSLSYLVIKIAITFNPYLI